MKVTSFWMGAVLLLGGLLVNGCGGGGGSGNPKGGLSGIVLDQNNNPVPGVAVFTNTGSDSQSSSSTAGSYFLSNVTGSFGTVFAQETVSGVQFSGQNLYQVFQGEQTKSVNIIVSQTNLQGQLQGTVYDRQGNVIGGTQIFAVSANNSSSITAISDNSGNYTLKGLVPNVNYTVEANALGFDSDVTTTNLTNSQTLQLNFNLNNASGALLNPPTGVFATAFTTPAEPSRSGDFASAIRNFKRIFTPKVYAAHRYAQSRTTPQGNLTEIDVTWTVASDPALYGWGIYRAVGNATPSSNGFVQLLYDPLASLFADLDSALLVGQQYTYAVTSLNTLYGQTGGDESPFSALASATVLGDMNLNPVTLAASPTFNWQAATDATGYTVTLYDQYPTVGINPIWTSASTSSLSQTYNGSGSLVTGQTYYYEVSGSDANGDQTFSIVDSFVGQ